MGKSISYCYKCSTLLREDDFARGKAFRDGDRGVCSRCAPHLKESTSSRSTSAVRISGTRKLALPSPGPEAGRSRLPLILAAAGGGVVILVLILVLVFRNGGTPPPPPPETASVPIPIAAPKPAEKSKTATPTPDQELLKGARKFAAEHPDDLAGQIKEFERVVWEFEKSPSAAEAKTEIAALKAKVAVQIEAAMAALEKEIEEPLRKEAFAAAIKSVEEAAGRLPFTEWTLAVSKRTRGIFDQARERQAELGGRIETLASEGKAAEVQEILRRVRSWGIPSLTEKAEAAAGTLAAAKTEDAPKAGAAPVESKPRTEEGKAYLARWESAMAKVAARDYAGALEDLVRAGASAKEPDLAAESRSDVEDVKTLQAAVKSILEDLLASPRAALSLEVRDGRKIGGRVFQIDRDRVELGSSKSSAFAEWSEVTAGSLAVLPRKQKVEPRVLAIFCLAEGDVEPAKAILGGALDAVVPKYWAWGAGAKAKLPKADPQEVAARGIFYSAEQEYRPMRTRGLAAEKYRTLRKDFLTTGVVRSALDRIERRSDAGREYVVAPSEMERAGTLKLTKAGKLESDADSDENFANQNWAETEFYALPATVYRAWVLAGGCCQPVFTFLWQATELTEINARTKKPGSADVGGALAPYAKISIRGLKPTHDPKTPKAPTRWEWIELPLPKYATPGPKRIRIMTDQKGFGIGALVISSTRKLPPKDEELKELDKARAADAPPRVTDPDLVAWWSLDDGTGTAAEDLSGNGHPGTLTGACAWRAGKIGGGLEFDGATSAVTVADAPDLRLTGDLTIAFWVIKKNPAGDWQRLVGKGDTNLRNYGVWTGGNENKVLWQQYGQDAKAVLQLNGTRDLPIGAWAHVAVTLRGEVATIYVDGAKDAEGTRNGAPATSDHPVTLGSSFHAPLAGSLDDVRIYRRALGPDEVRELFEMGR